MKINLIKRHLKIPKLNFNNYLALKSENLYCKIIKKDNLNNFLNFYVYSLHIVYISNITLKILLAENVFIKKCLFH